MTSGMTYKNYKDIQALFQTILRVMTMDDKLINNPIPKMINTTISPVGKNFWLKSSDTGIFNQIKNYKIAQCFKLTIVLTCL